METKKDKRQALSGLDRIVQVPGSRVLYYLEDGSCRTFVNEELMYIPEDTQVHSEWVSKWKKSHIIL